MNDISGIVTEKYQFGRFQLDLPARKLSTTDGKLIEISSRAFDVLCLLVTNHGKTLSKSAIMESVWPGMVVEENNLNQAIFLVRRALGDSRGDIQYIKNVPGRGYCFIAEIYHSEIIEDHKSAPDIPKTAQSLRSDSLLAANRKKNSQQTFALFNVAPILVLALSLITYVIWDQNQVQETINSESDYLEPHTPIANSVAVLPVNNLSNNPGWDNFITGLQIDIIGNLSKIDTINVISRPKLLDLLAEGPYSSTEIANILGVESILSGELFEHNNTVRVSLHLFNPESGLSLWSGTREANTLDENSAKSFQKDLTGFVTQVFKSREEQLLDQVPEEMHTNSSIAYRYALGAKNAYLNFNLKKSWELSHKALEIDPDNLDALYIYSKSNAFLSANPVEGMSIDFHLNAHIESTQKLLKYEPDSARVNKLKIMSLIFSRNWASVPDQMEKLNPSDSKTETVIDSSIGAFYLITGEPEKAIKLYEQRIVEDPLNLNTIAQLITAHEILRQYDIVDRYYTMGEELQDNWFGENVYLLVRLGRQLPPIDIKELNIPVRVKELLFHLDDTSYMIQALTELVDANKKSPAEAIHLGALAAYTGENKLALVYLNQAVSSLSMMIYYLWLPLFDEVRHEPEFTIILEENGLLDYWNEFGWPDWCDSKDKISYCPV